jgi:hypothetical protein
VKKIKDLQFYNALDDKIKDILPFREFLLLERKNQYDCQYYQNLIEKIAEISYIENESFFDKILNFIQVLDLEPEKIGRNIKDCNFINELDIKNNFL